MTLVKGSTCLDFGQEPGVEGGRGVKEEVGLLDFERSLRSQKALV